MITHYSRYDFEKIEDDTDPYEVPVSEEVHTLSFINDSEDWIVTIGDTKPLRVGQVLTFGGRTNSLVTFEHKIVFTGGAGTKLLSVIKERFNAFS